MSKPIIEIENISKRYRLGAHKEPYLSLREEIAKLGSRFKSRADRKTDQDFWALKDVSFSVQEGEAVGIIGRNGAGKSTLLKILSQITPPTKGKITMRGRVASLLEVGTGFHPELSGSENIFLNGTILGMTRREVARKFDEIVAFAEVEKFLDTPVKRYSSGMYVRLAFAVAAHLEPEILIVDEVLAVGDASFQKKCLGKMEEVATGGRTVLFVSHNMTALQSLCRRAIWLNSGEVVECGETRVVVADYLQKGSQCIHEQRWDDAASAPGNDKVRLQRVAVLRATGENNAEMTVITPLNLEFEFWNFKAGSQLNLSLHLYTIEGTCVLVSTSPLFTGTEGLIKGICRIPGNFLNDGTYRAMIMVVQDTSTGILMQEDALIFKIHESGRTGMWHGKWPGVVRPSFSWSVDMPK